MSGAEQHKTLLIAHAAVHSRHSVTQSPLQPLHSALLSAQLWFLISPNSPLALHQMCPKSGPGTNHGTRSDFIWPAALVLICIIYGQPALSNRIDKNKNFSFHLMVASSLCNFAWLCDPCCDPFQLISAMATADKKRKIDGQRFQDRWKLQYFFTETKQLCLPNLPRDCWHV